MSNWDVQESGGTDVCGGDQIDSVVHLSRS